MHLLVLHYTTQLYSNLSHIQPQHCTSNQTSLIENRVCYL